MNKKIEALYIHIPFCNNICTYCDFYKMIAKEETKTKYIDYLIKELYIKEPLLKNIKTIYIGGGTPSSISTKNLERLLHTIKKIIDLHNVIEYTIEVNPQDITDDLAKLFKNMKINRISMGVQSLNENQLKFLNRKHNIETVTKAITHFQNNAINNINCDILYAVYEDNFERIKHDVDYLINLGIVHFSLYSLILEEKTVLYHKYLKNEFKLMDEDEEAKLYYKIVDYMKSKKFKHYEISNFCKDDLYSKHNLIYWHNDYYLGVGANASYYYKNTRYTNINNLEKYYQGIDNKRLIFKEEDKLNKFEIMQEEFMISLRLTQGVSVNQFKNKFDENPFEVFPFIKDLIKEELLILKDDFLFIPENKFYISNSILVYFV
ncbi:MAG TPA: radical SAM family heme chaperone HemW [Acholeplasmataceae bacterium]|nr:radical SAM family heme chaperone HemW [Acholeplasmataceae bacterium]